MRPFSASSARPDLRSALVASLFAVTLLAACATDEVAAPRLIPSDASRGIGTAATWTWSGYGTPFGQSGGYLTAINDSGHVAGFRDYQIRNGVPSRRVSFASYGPRSSEFVDLDSVYSANAGRRVLTRPLGINNSGHVLVDAFPETPAVIERNGRLTYVYNGFIGVQAVARAIRGTGTVVGSGNPLNIGAGFIWRSGIWRDVTPRGWTGATVNGIDSSGTIYGGSVRLIYTTAGSIRQMLSCAWMHRRGTNYYQNCIVQTDTTSSGPPRIDYEDANQEFGVLAVNARGDAIGNLWSTSGTGATARRFTRGTFTWPASDATLTPDPIAGRRWVAISDKGRLVGTEPASAGHTILVTKSPTGVIQLILPNGLDARPMAINRCGVIGGGAKIGSPPQEFYSLWTPSSCD